MWPSRWLTPIKGLSSPYARAPAAGDPLRGGLRPGFLGLRLRRLASRPEGDVCFLDGGSDYGNDVA